MSEQTNSTRTSIIADRIAGLGYEEIARKHGVHPASARRICKRAMLRGEVSAEQIRHRFLPKLSAPKADYDTKWVARVKARCVIDANGCWLWKGFLKHNGYGNTNYRNDSVTVHRKMLEIKLGVDMTPDEYACHTCDVKQCCNPDHLWKGAAADNNMDSRNKGRHYEATRTHCPRGHAYDESNTYLTPEGSRSCKTCSRARMRIAAGWPEHLAYTLGRVPSGYTWEDVCKTQS